MVLFGVVCWVLRVFFVIVVPAEHIPPVMRRALQHLAPAVLTAIGAVEVTSVLSAAESVASSLAVAAMALVAGVADRWRNSGLTMIVAVVAILVLDLVVL